MNTNGSIQQISRPPPPPAEPSGNDGSVNSSSDYSSDSPLASSIALLCDDTLLRILSYADLPSLVRFARGTSASLRRRFHPANDFGSLRRGFDVWREAFANLHLAPAATADAATGKSCVEGELSPQYTDYFDAIRQRQALWSILCGNYSRRKKRSARQCFSLPSRLFRFVPLVPPDMMHFPPASGGNENDISFSYLDESDEDGEENDDDFDIDVERNEDLGADNNAFDHVGSMESDPPPVEFACDSFALTSPGIDGELVVLNPFSGSVEVYGSILDNAISSDESVMEQAMMDASEGIIRKRRIRGGGDRRASFERYLEEDDESSEVIAGEAINSRVQLNHKMYDTPPKQVLFSVDDYFDLDIGEYFGRHTPFASSGRREGGNVTVDWVGVDSHLAIGEDYRSIAGNIIGAARILNMESDRGEDELACTEVLAWSNFDKDLEGPRGDADYSSKYVCRVAGSFYFLDICSSYKKVYAAFQSGCCPFDGDDGTGAAAARRGDRGGRQLMDIEEESMVNEDGGPIRLSSNVYCLPLVKHSDSASSSCPEMIRSYFPSPDARFVASYPVSSISVDPTGKILIIGTIYGTVEIWHTGMDHYNSSTLPMRLQNLSVRESLMKRHRSMTMDERRTSTGGTDANGLSAVSDINNKPRIIEFEDDLALLENSAIEEDEFPHRHPNTKISQIYLPRHLPAHECGFVTKQRSLEAGTTLLLWQTPSLSSEKAQGFVNDHFRIVAMINLPLSAQCHPEVYYDGRRLVVFGKDHIGLIILVYHILGTRFDQSEFEGARSPGSTKCPKGKRGGGNGEESGGVVQIGGERRVRFVNRIRHAGLDGLEYYDSMLMTANERFLVVNTKAGNLVGSDGARNASEGLLVIDLQEYSCY